MENLSAISSEEELTKLREEGKVSQAEYEELHAAMAKQSDEKIPLEADKPKSKDKLGKLALILMLTGFVLHAVLWWFVDSAAQGRSPNLAAPKPWFFLGVAFEISAFVLGIIAWSSAFGKAVVVTIAFILVLLVLFTS
ncbi:MAG: hypothetical protein KAR11_02830 [Phycisphaerae bacterium]|nr:hypothetical protein [Phycisphaerae bacterium]